MPVGAVIGRGVRAGGHGAGRLRVPEPYRLGARAPRARTFSHAAPVYLTARRRPLCGSALCAADGRRAARGGLARPARRIGGAVGEPTCESALNQRLTEHAYLAAAATGARSAAGPTNPKSATAALDANSLDLARTIGAVYGAEAGKSFLELWRQHIVFLIDYARATGRKNTPHAGRCGAEPAGVCRGLRRVSGVRPTPTCREADRRGAPPHPRHAGSRPSWMPRRRNDSASAYAKLRDVAAHMQRIADPLAAAISKQFPERFPCRDCNLLPRPAIQRGA